METDGELPMTLLEVQSRVGADGVLKLALPVGAENANREVRITINAVEQPSTTATMSQQEWEEFIDRIGGSINDPTFIRHPQPAFEDRGEIFP
jgi:hypothetical protein